MSVSQLRQKSTAQKSKHNSSVPAKEEDSTLKMLCARGPFMGLYWPVRSLWPEVRPLLLQRNLLELSSHLELMDQLQHKILEETEPSKPSAAVKPVSWQLKEGERFGLTLDAQGFSPEDLSVRQVGRKLRVSGRTEEKREDDNGCSSYSLREFRQEFDLPEGLDPDAITCHLDQDGKLHIRAAEEAERKLTISTSTEEEKPQQSSHTEDKPQNMD